MTTPAASAEPPRLQKVLARAGWGSRRACEELIAAGRVTVDGRVARLGDRAEPQHQRIEVDGIRVAPPEGTVVYLLNKPAGVLSTAADTHGRRTVTELVPADPRVFPVGRLDLDTEGLLLLTNDGELAQLLTHPRHEVEKEYLAEVEGVPDAGALRRLREGVELEDGRTAPARVALAGRGSGRAALRIVLREGRKREVRRMCAAVGHPVRRLVRTRIGPIRDPRLPTGAWRVLTPDEIRALEAAARPTPAERPSPPTRPGGAGRGAG